MEKHKKKGNVLSSVCGALWMVAILAALYMIMEYPSNVFGLVGMGLVILGLGIIALSGMGRQDKEWAGGNEGGSQLQEMLNAQKALYVVNKQNEELLRQLLKVQQSQVNEILEGNKNIAKVIVKKNMESTDKLIQSNASFMLNNAPIEVEEPTVINEQLTEKMIEKLAAAWQKTLEESNANLVSQMENALNLSSIQQLGERMPEELAQAMNFAMVPFVEGIDTMPQKLAQALDKDSFLRELKAIFELHAQDKEQNVRNTYEEMITQAPDQSAAATLDDVLQPMEEVVEEQDFNVTEMLEQEVEPTEEPTIIMTEEKEEQEQQEEQESEDLTEQPEFEELDIVETEQLEKLESIDLQEAEELEESDTIELQEAVELEELDTTELQETVELEEPDTIDLQEAVELEEPDTIDLQEAVELEKPDTIESLEAMEAEITELLGLEGNEPTEEEEKLEEPDAIESLEAMEAEITELLGLEENEPTEEPEGTLKEREEEPEEEIQIPDINLDVNRMLNPDEIAALVAGVSEPEPLLAQEEVQDDLPEEETEEEPEEDIQIPDISMDTNRMLNPDEIAALIAGVSEPETESNEKVQEAELAAAEEDSQQSDVEAEGQEEPVEIHVSEDSNRQLSPEEIAALFASI